MKRLFLAFLTTLLLASFAMADTIYLRDGSVVRGTLLGFINGRFAVRLSTGSATTVGATTNAGGEIVFYRPNEVERIEIDGRSFDELRFETREVQVSLGPDWIDSGVDVRRNERIKITANGTIVAGRSRITPEGLRSFDPNSPLPRSAEGMLIGAIGNDTNSPVLELGSSREFVAERSGRLYLTANRSSYTDARGSFNVQVQRERDLTARGDREVGPIEDRTGTTAPRRPRGGARRGPLEVSVNVPGTSRGVDTNIDLRVGDQVTFTAQGTVVAGRRAGEVGPDGGRSSGLGSIVSTRPVPNAGVGALIGFIRMSNGQISQPFLIGSQSTYTAAADGRLVLAINDDNYTDNSGDFNVKITHQR